LTSSRGGEDTASDHLCVEMRDTYHVVPGSSWGTLPIEDQR
jgi:hypothetical protein